MICSHNMIEMETILTAFTDKVWQFMHAKILKNNTFQAKQGSKKNASFDFAELDIIQNDLY